MKQWLALFLALFALVISASAHINIWQPFGVVVGTSGSVYPAQPNVIPVASGCNTVASPCFAMWYSCNTLNTCYAESPDGKTWTNYASNPVMTNAAYPKVYAFGGVYYAYTTTFSGNCSTPMATQTSTDRVTWTVQNASSLACDQSWESKFIGQPGTGNPIAGIYTTYYTSFDAALNGYVEGEATTTDLIHFTKNVINPQITANFPGNFNFHNIGTLFYGWTLTRNPNLPQDGTDPGLPSDIGRYNASNVGGPWAALPASVFYRTRLEEGIGLTTGQVADPNLIEVSTSGPAVACTSTADCSVYMYYSDSTNGRSNTTSQISLAIAPNQTFASLAQLQEGVFDVPIPTLAGFALNLNTVASDSFSRANQNPIAGNWSTVSTSAGIGGLQLLSDAATSSATGNASYSYWNAASWSADQWGQITIGTVPTAGSNCSMGVLLRASTSGALTEYIASIAGSGTGAAYSFHAAKYVSGTYTAIPLNNTADYTLSIGDTITASMIGSTLSIYDNANLIATATDTSISSGAVGMSANTNGNALSNLSISGWSGGGVQNPPSIGVGTQIGVFLVSSNKRQYKPLVFR